MNGSPGLQNNVEAISARAQALVQQGAFAEAAEFVREELKDVEIDSRHSDALYVLAVAERYRKRYEKALDALGNLQAVAPDHARCYQEQGHAFFTLDRYEEARGAYEKAVQRNPALVASWKALTNLYRIAGLESHSAWALEQVRFLDNLPPELLSVASMLHENRLAKAERLCRHFLQNHEHHPEGMRLLAQIADKLDVSGDAEFLLESCVELHPDYVRGRRDYANLLLKMQKFAKARGQCEVLLARNPDSAEYRSMLASATAGIGEHAEAIEMFNEVLRTTRHQNTLYVMRGHAEKTIGKLDDAIRSYRKAYEIKPDYGDAFWSLANTKTYRFSDSELEHMKAAEGAAATATDDRIHLCFALGKAFEDRAAYAESFAWYEKGNSLKQDEVKHRAAHLATRITAQTEVFTESFIGARAGNGFPAPDPVFIVGLPRAGSTLLEQILASHPLVDGTHELPNIISLVQRLRGNRAVAADDGKPNYPGVLAEIGEDYLYRFGEQYIEDTRVYRKGAPFFIDKNPNNFFHIGLVRLILPNAKIIDARRHPMACCFSGFKQLFGQGQEFSYGLTQIGNYYRQYVKLMDHWDRVLPGFVLRVHHEDVVEDLEEEVRRILEFCGLPFDEACLNFHATDRSVRTPSSEQVRQPIYRSGLHHWQNFAPWLKPLEDALGRDVLERPLTRHHRKEKTTP